MKESAGLLMYRRTVQGLEVFLVHPGGPYFARRDRGSWGLPKGELEAGETALEVAHREFAEETGQTVEACARSSTLIPLGSIRQRGGKRVQAWAFEGEWPAGAELHSNRFTMEWPPRSGKQCEFPEVDRAAFFAVAEALERINEAQAELILRLQEKLAVS